MHPVLISSLQPTNTEATIIKYKSFGNGIEFKKYLADAGSKFLFRSGTHGLNEELGR